VIGFAENREFLLPHNSGEKMNPKRCFFLFCLLFFSLSQIGFSESPNEFLQKNVSPLSPLRAGDILHIKVFNNRGVLEIDKDFFVNSNGAINIPILGQFKVAGKNINELEDDLSRVFAQKAFKSPRVQVNGVKFVFNNKLFVFGGVKNPGSIDFRDKISVMDAIRAAGGFEEGTQIDGAMVWTGTNFLDSKAHQTAFQITRSLDFLEGTKIRRAGKEIPVNLKKLLQEGDISQNLPLFNNDVLFVPRFSSVAPLQEESIYILGAVQNPGRYRFRENLTVIDALSLAGGLWNPSNLKFASIIRGAKPKSGAISSKPEVLKIDLRRLFFRRDLSCNHVVRANDILLVSTRQFRNVLSDVGKFIDNLLPFVSRLDSVVGYDDSIRKFNDQFLR